MIISIGSAINAVGVVISLYASLALADWQFVTSGQLQANGQPQAKGQLQANGQFQSNGQLQANYPILQDAFNALSQIGHIAENVKYNLLLNQLSLNDQNKVSPPNMIASDIEDTLSIKMNPQETIEFQLSMLTLHNKLRTNAGLPPLEWSPKLAEFALVSMVATEHATRSCPVKGSSQAMRKTVGPFTNVGENLFVHNFDNIPTAEDAISSWYNQGLCYLYNTFGNACTTAFSVSPQTACNDQQAKAATQFTQVMWSTTTHVGCSIHKCSTCTTNGCPQYVVGCIYGSTIVPYGGNFVGAVPFDSTVAQMLNIPQCNSAQQPQKQFLAYQVILSQSPSAQVNTFQVIAKQVTDALSQMSNSNMSAAQGVMDDPAVVGINQIIANAPYYQQATFNTANPMGNSLVASASSEI